MDLTHPSSYRKINTLESAFFVKWGLGECEKNEFIYKQGAIKSIITSRTIAIKINIPKLKHMMIL